MVNWVYGSLVKWLNGLLGKWSSSTHNITIQQFSNSKIPHFINSTTQQSNKSLTFAAHLAFMFWLNGDFPKNILPTWLHKFPSVRGAGKGVKVKFINNAKG
jgi:hypothetical protein